MQNQELKLGYMVDFTESDSYSGTCLKVVNINGSEIGLETMVDGTIDDDYSDEPQIIYIDKK